MWAIWKQAKAYSTTPSALLRIAHPVLAFYFDRAVYIFGQRLEDELAGVGQKKGRSETQQRMAQTMILQRWLGINNFAAPTRRRGR